ncbi:polyphosphate kinase 2 family protein [Arthrobacter sp. M4]|uniref:polyphosphate kinase 2 family protein n=1 Tax=Arthrobacter sp. M4 TaxID=218160 RepID=UPI001CDBD959|nr:polyphosphate kinase 2 family protein [Arthrobacter sp. M4]MCA4132396.1 polyphosphate kinase 2 family protein [Arthrobacter sp. M4]
MSGPVEFLASPSETLRVAQGFQLGDVDPDATPGYAGGKAEGVALLSAQDSKLAELQEMLFACGRFGSDRRVLLILQAMDTAGKGGIVAHVVGSMDPQGVQLKAFKAPTEEERAHDFLWRIENAVPGPGMVGVFDRSHYEDVLIHRVHGWARGPELARRYAAINDFEERLVQKGTAVVKVMLHISRDEQRKRLLARLDDPTKRWKYNPGDVEERAFWESYMESYQLVFEKTNSPAPWHVIPANKKWYARIAVQQLLLETLGSLGLEWPTVEYDVQAERLRVLQ